MMTPQEKEDFKRVQERVFALEENHASMVKILENSTRNITDELVTLQSLLKGDGTEDNPGVVKTFKWIAGLRVYAKASWIVLVFIIGIFWGAVKFWDFIKPHLSLTKH